MSDYEQIASIELVFENCDWIELPFIIGKTSVYQYDIMEWYTHDSTGRFYKEKTALITKIMLPNSQLNHYTHFGTILLNQLLFQDIVEVCIKFANKTEYRVGVLYPNDDVDYTQNKNPYQKNNFTNDYIEITIEKES